MPVNLTLPSQRVVNRVHQPGLAYVQSGHEPGIIMRIMTLIIEIVKKIFDFFQFWKEDPYELEARQLQAFKRIQLESYLKPMGPPPRNDYERFRHIHLIPRVNARQDVNLSITPLESPEDTQIRSEYEGKDFPLSLQNMRRVLSKIVDNTIDCVQEEKIVPFTEGRMEYVEKATRIIKDVSAISIEIGFRLKVPIFNMLRNNHINVPNTELLEESSKKALNWLIENEEIEDYKTEVTRHLKETLQNLTNQRTLHLNSEVEDLCVQSVIDWVFNEERTGEFHDTYPKSTHPEETVEAIYQQCLTLLINKKFDILCSDLNNRLIERLPDHIHLFLKTNGSIIIDEISGRIADLLSHINMSKIVDDLTYALFKQTTTYIEAKQLVSQEFEGAFRERNARSDIEKEYIKMCAKKFATLPDAHPKSQEIVTIPRGKDPLTWPVSEGFKKWKESIEERFVGEVCQKMIEILFPKKKNCEEDGSIVEIDGLAHMWKRIVIPEGIKEIVSEVEGFIDQFLPVDYFTFAKDARTTVNNMAEQAVMTAAKTQLGDFISKKLFTLFKSLVAPEQFFHLLKSYIAPVVEEQCIDLMTRSALSNDIEKFNSEFSSLRALKKELNSHLSGVRTFILEKLKRFYREREQEIENMREHLERLTDLISRDFETALFSENNHEATIETISSSLSASTLGESNFHHEIAASVVVPHLSAIQTFIQTALEKAINIGRIEKQLAEKLHALFTEEAKEFRRLGGFIAKETFLSRIAGPMINEFEMVLTNREFDADHPHAAIGKYLKGDEREVLGMNIYSEIVFNLLFGVGEFGSFTEYVASSFKSQINHSIAKTLSRFRNDDYLLVGMISKKLMDKFSSKEAIREAFFAPAVQENPADLSEGITRISAIVYDIVKKITVPSTGFSGMIQNMCVTTFLGSDSTDINNTIRKIFSRLFQDDLLNANLVFRIKDVLTSAFEIADMAIKQEQSSYTGIPSESFSGSGIFSPGNSGIYSSQTGL